MIDSTCRRSLSESLRAGSLELAVADLLDERPERSDRRDDIERRLPAAEAIALGCDELLGAGGLCPPPGDRLGDDCLEIVDVVEEAVVELVDRRIEIARHGEIDEQERATAPSRAARRQDPTCGRSARARWSRQRRRRLPRARRRDRPARARAHRACRRAPARARAFGSRPLRHVRHASGDCGPSARSSCRARAGAPAARRGSRRPAGRAPLRQPEPRPGSRRSRSRRELAGPRAAPAGTAGRGTARSRRPRRRSAPDPGSRPRPARASRGRRRRGRDAAQPPRRRAGTGRRRARSARSPASVGQRRDGGSLSPSSRRAR